ncbi:hypothetical protein, partial [Endozoicomonas sp. ONNA2]|uniref:hypothetical protein n=1 Tax=Endozoicomonas sp. ONNA2 TaxID=2828741 RepID=UPI0021479D93
ASYKAHIGKAAVKQAGGGRPLVTEVMHLFIIRIQVTQPLGQAANKVRIEENVALIKQGLWQQVKRAI